MQAEEQSGTSVRWVWRQRWPWVSKRDGSATKSSTGVHTRRTRPSPADASALPRQHISVFGVQVTSILTFIKQPGILNTY